MTPDDTLNNKPKKRLKKDGTPSKSGTPNWRPKPGKPVKNPKIGITPEVIEEMAYEDLNQSTMADLIGMERHYLADRIASEPELQKAIRRGHARLNRDIKKAQQKMALDPKNFRQAVMLIWLGKNICGQKDLPEGQQQAATKIEFVFPEAPVEPE